MTRTEDRAGALGGLAVARPRAPSPLPAALRWPFLTAVVAALAVSNVLNNGVLPADAYVPWNLAVAAVLLGITLWSGLGLADIGFDRRTWRRSAVVGLIAIGVIATAYLVAVVLPFTRAAFDDGRVGSSGSSLLYHAAFQIPLGTVVLEEVASRGVLPALLGWRAAPAALASRALTPDRWCWPPALWASLLFGLWHVLPAARVLNQNAAYHDVLGGRAVLASVVAVAAMLLAGLGLLWMRWVGRGLLTSMLVHLGTNSLGFLAA